MIGLSHFFLVGEDERKRGFHFPFISRFFLSDSSTTPTLDSFPFIFLVFDDLFTSVMDFTLHETENNSFQFQSHSSSCSTNLKEENEGGELPPKEKELKDEIKRLKKLLQNQIKENERLKREKNEEMKRSKQLEEKNHSLFNSLHNLTLAIEAKDQIIQDHDDDDNEYFLRHKEFDGRQNRFCDSEIVSYVFRRFADKLSEDLFEDNSCFTFETAEEVEQRIRQKWSDSETLKVKLDRFYFLFDRWTPHCFTFFKHLLQEFNSRYNDYWVRFIEKHPEDHIHRAFECSSNVEQIEFNGPFDRPPPSSFTIFNTIMLSDYRIDPPHDSSTRCLSEIKHQNLSV